MKTKLMHDHQNVHDLIQQRRAVRAFRPDPVPHDTLVKILDTARWSPSGVNMQPWRVAVVTGARLTTLSEKLQTAYENNEINPDYAYYPDRWAQPFNDRRMQLGKSIYATYGRMNRRLRGEVQIKKNLAFFGAPAAILIFTDHSLTRGAWLDCGMFAQSVMIATQATGLASCPQASIADYPDVVRGCLDLPDTDRLLCSIAVGLPDADDPLNTIDRTRAEIPEFVKFIA